jgi:redox-sensitive bicupin YhaK (pirin superfamily)
MCFVLEGQVEVEGQVLDRRDGLGVWDADQLTVKASADSEVLLMEVPMTV